MQLESDKTSVDANFVTFYRNAIQNGFKSKQAGHPVFEDVDYVRIVSPGGLNVIETPVRSDHKARYPRLWANYQAAMDGKAAQIGTPVTEWPLITRAQAETLKGMQIHTVEQIAACSDLQAQGFQMIAPDLRGRAQSYLRAAHSAASAEADAAEKKRFEDEKAAMQAKIDAQAAQLGALQEAVARLSAEKPKRGRPRKEAQAA